jgi:hypothetical protein
MRADPELPAEHPDQVGGVGVQFVRRRPERQLLLEPDVDQVPQVSRHADARPGHAVRAGPAQMAAQPFGDEGQPVLRLEFLAWLIECQVQLVNALAQQRIGEHGLADGPPDQALRQLREVQVEHPLAEASGRGGPPVVRDLRGQERDELTQGAMLVPVQVVPDHPVVDDQQRPRFVRVHGVDVAGHARVEDLDDAGDIRPPRSQPRVIRHAKIVQDAAAGGGV